MKRVALLAMFAFGLLTAPALADGGGIRGFVDAYQGAGLNGARVSLIGPYGTVQTTADRDGFFVFLSVPTGKYDIYASEEGYVPGCRLGVVVEPDEVRDVTIIALVRSTVISHCIGVLDQPLFDRDATADVYDVH
jgi:hypothetical protein